MTMFRAVLMLVVIAVLFLTFLPMLAIAGLGDLNTPKGYVPPTTAAPSTSTASQTTTATSSPSSGSNVTITSTSIAFDKTQITVPAGEVTITYVNHDNGVPHNINAFDGPNNSAKSLGATKIEAGPNTQTLKLNLKPGTYYFQCDVHPTQMKGTITAQ